MWSDDLIPVESYQGLVAQVDGPDPDDNVHMAAAVAGRIESLVTRNVKDFDCGFTKKHAIKIVDPDQYLCGLYEELPAGVLATINRLVGSAAAPAALAPGVRLWKADPARRGGELRYVDEADGELVDVAGIACGSPVVQL